MFVEKFVVLRKGGGNAAVGFGCVSVSNGCAERGRLQRFANESRVERSAVLLGIKMGRRSVELRSGRSAKLRVSPMYGTEGAKGVR